MPTSVEELPLAYQPRQPKKKRASSSDSSISCSSSSTRTPSSSSTDSREAKKSKPKKKKKQKDRPLFRRRPGQPKRPRPISRDKRARPNKKRLRRCSSSSCDSSTSHDSDRRLRIFAERSSRWVTSPLPPPPPPPHWSAFQQRPPAWRKSHECGKCDQSFGSQKGLLHHEMQVHSIGAECFVCREKFDTCQAWKDHALKEHPNDDLGCVFCKSRFEKPSEVNSGRWEFIKAHLYGEILYSRLAEIEEKNAERIPKKMPGNN